MSQQPGCGRTASKDQDGVTIISESHGADASACLCSRRVAAGLFLRFLSAHGVGVSNRRISAARRRNLLARVECRAGCSDSSGWLGAAYAFLTPL
ncbi:hypothetical protein GUJ93_ZPchr0013g34133 [Zizania palustris]|uniref:Uncharacterized protein n=1 Tax=Zizania palustris TaxID=103762 RepID=A0A8J5WZJ0_ZIZPA|nr:hypothetical protein GUJ93_ZPchr0013g34133 [Zizania palustris]